MVSLTGAAPGAHGRRLLFLLPHVPAFNADTGGARSTAQLIAGLAARNQVAVLALRFANDLPAPDSALRRACHLFEVIDQRSSAASAGWRHRFQHRIMPLVSRPRWVLSADVPAYHERLRTLLRDWQPDIVHVLYHVMAQYASELDACDAPRVLTQYEPGAAAAFDAARGMRGLSGIRAQLEARAWARYERQVIRRFDAVVVLTERDRRALARSVSSVPVHRIPLGVSTPERLLNPDGSGSPSLLFVGNFIHPPNVDAASWLIRSIFPRVTARRPDAALVIAGPNPPSEITAMAGPHVEITGAVDSVTPLLDRASVVVAPMRVGGGMRVKLLEALSFGKAVVASPLSAEGLDLESGDQLLIAGDEDQFADAIVQLLDDPVERRRLAGRAAEWARTHLSWSRPVAAYEELHDRLVPLQGLVTPAPRRGAALDGECQPASLRLE